MKYYYKSPEQLRKDQEKGPAKKLWQRNRGRTIIIADIAILALVAAILYYFGYFGTRDIAGIRPASYRGLEFMISARSPSKKTTGSAMSSRSSNSSKDTINRRKELVVYLHIRNELNHAVEFPDRRTPYELTKCTVEFFRNGSKIGEMFPVLSRRRIEPGETRLYRIPLRLPDFGTGARNEIQISLRLQLSTGLVQLRLPNLKNVPSGMP